MRKGIATMLLSACTDFCAALETAVGPQLAEWICIAAVAVLTWWKTRKVHLAAQAGIASAKADASEAKISLARLEGSLRPAALTPTPPRLGSSSSQSGNFEPVAIPAIIGDPMARPPLDPSLAQPTFPRPSAVPAIDDETHSRG